MSDDGMLHLSNAPNPSALWSPSNVVNMVCGFVLFVLLVVIAHGQSQTLNELRRLNLESSPQGSPPVKYEYFIETTVQIQHPDISKYLNDKGSQGWILVQYSMSTNSGKIYQIIFKRPL